MGINQKHEMFALIVVYFFLVNATVSAIRKLQKYIWQTNMTGLLDCGLTKNRHAVVFTLIKTLSYSL